MRCPGWRFAYPGYKAGIRVDAVVVLIRLTFKRARHGVGVFSDDGKQYLGRLVGAVRALLQISDRPEREAKPRCELFPHQVLLLAQRAYRRHTASAREL
jgi:hypothetical protein